MSSSRSSLTPATRRNPGDGAVWFPARWGAVAWWLTLLGFVTLTVLVLNGTTASMDSSMTMLVVTARSDALTRIALAVTWAGTFPFILAFAAAASAGVDRWLDTPWRSLIRVTAVLCADVVVVAAIKGMMDRPRPPSDLRVVAVITRSFPSGHTTATAAVVWLLFLTVVAANRSGTARLTAMVLAVLVTLAMGWSRVYLGVHYITDVVGGALLGLWLALSTAWLFDVVGAGRRRSALQDTTRST
jgi:undecaprenyl-diphosphatase